MNLPLHNHEKTLAMLQHDEHSNATDRNLRKHSVWQKAEGEGRKQWEEASKNYFKIATKSHHLPHHTAPHSTIPSLMHYSHAF
jgi:hypothetical protein